MKPKKPHKHTMVPVEKEVDLYKYEPSPNGGYTQGGTVARDIIKGFKCACGFATASDIERKVI